MSKPEYNDHAARWNYMQELLEELTPPKDSTSKKRKYITRVDNDEKSAHYWQVNIETTTERYNKVFCDLKNGDKSSALLAAVTWRDRKLTALNIKIIKGLEKQPFVPEAKGVCFRIKKWQGYEYPYFRAYWHEPGIDGKQVRREKLFSISTHGFKRARQKAIKFRRDKLKELYG